MEPITREEYYLAKIAGTYEGMDLRFLRMVCKLMLTGKQIFMLLDRIMATLKVGMMNLR